MTLVLNTHARISIATTSTSAFLSQILSTTQRQIQLSPKQNQVTTTFKSLENKNNRIDEQQLSSKNGSTFQYKPTLFEKLANLAAAKTQETFI
jgi:hypothetical protein